MFVLRDLNLILIFIRYSIQIGVRTRDETGQRTQDSQIGLVSGQAGEHREYFHLSNILIFSLIQIFSWQSSSYKVMRLRVTWLIWDRNINMRRL